MVHEKDLEDNDFEDENHPNLNIVLARVDIKFFNKYFWVF